MALTMCNTKGGDFIQKYACDFLPFLPLTANAKPNVKPNCAAFKVSQKRSREEG